MESWLVWLQLTVGNWTRDEIAASLGGLVETYPAHQPLVLAWPAALAAKLGA
jgi:hypothetical protein